MLIVDVKEWFTKSDGSRIYAWRTVSASEALRKAAPRLRCPECYGAVGLFGASENGKMPERAEHRKRNPGCSLGDCFNGIKQKATTQIEPEQVSMH